MQIFTTISDTTHGGAKIFPCIFDLVLRVDLILPVENTSSCFHSMVLDDPVNQPSIATIETPY